MIDARSYDYLEDRSWGRRRDFGFVGAVRMGCPKDDGPGRTDGIGQAAFGNGYGRQLDRDQITSTLETRTSGERRFTVTIPRVYFYHHEWQLGNANSQVGIDAVMSVAKAAGAGGLPYSDELTFLLTRSVHHRSYASRLAVLELSSEGTGRWSVHLY
jgi:hypothetical protein